MNPPSRSVRIGLVEDHEIVHVGLRGVLNSIDGWELAVVARSVRDLDLRNVDLDLVLLDLRLEDGSSPVARRLIG